MKLKSGLPAVIAATVGLICLSGCQSARNDASTQDGIVERFKLDIMTYDEYISVNASEGNRIVYLDESRDSAVILPIAEEEWISFAINDENGELVIILVAREENAYEENRRLVWSTYDDSGYILDAMNDSDLAAIALKELRQIQKTATFIPMLGTSNIERKNFKRLINWQNEMLNEIRERQ